MIPIVIDFETYYDRDYSLSKLSTAAYVLDPRFRAFGAAICWDGKPARWCEGPQLPAFFNLIGQQVGWQNIAVVAHHTRFDGAVLAWRYGVRPGRYIDTMGMAQAMVYAYTGSASLKAVAAYLGAGQKGDALNQLNMAGRYYNQLTPAERDHYAAYAKTDADLCWLIYQKMLAAGFPESELALIDELLRMYLEPTLRLDPMVLSEHLATVRSRKRALLESVGIDPDADNARRPIMSNEQFAGLLRARGVEPPMKISPTTGQPTYAFSKTDFAFKELLEDEDLEVQALVAARLGLKSTIEETRAERLLKISMMQNGPAVPRSLTLAQPATDMLGWLPVPLRYCAAHTGRLGGDEKINLQNLNRAEPDPTRPGKNRPHALRRAIIAPPGYKIVTADASQIEARVTAWLAGQQDLVDAFARGDDIYSGFAGQVYGKPVNKKDHPGERFVGKTSILGLGFGMGAAKFKDTIRIQAANQGIQGISLDDAEALRVVKLYRHTYPMIPKLWLWGDTVLDAMLSGDDAMLAALGRGPLRVGRRCIWLPNGLPINYRDLRTEMVTGPYGPKRQFLSTYGKLTKKLWGGVITENVVQGTARIITLDVIAKLSRRYPAPLAYRALTVHDQLVYVVRDDVAAEFYTVLLAEMATVPPWAQGLPLAAEGGIGDRLSEAEGK